MKFHVVAALVKTVFSGFRPCDELQRYRTLDFRILCRRNLEQVICAQIHYHKFVLIDEAAAVSTRLELLPADFYGRIRDEISLVFLLDARRVAGAVDERSEHKKPIGVAHPAGIAHLGGTHLAAEIDSVRK